MSLDQLIANLGVDSVKTDSDSLALYGKDWTQHFTAKAKAVVFPKSTEEVQSLVQWARQTKTALVPSGGRTGLSAGAYATNDEVVVSFERMNKILNFNEVDQSITCQAGVITEKLQQHALEKGLLYPVDFAARGSSHIGGNIATNAGGIKVLRYGLTRNWVSGLKVVTGSGEILDLNNDLIKNASGYDLRHLIIGSEGTLGFVTEATLRLTRPPQELSLFLFACQELDSILNIYKKFRTEVDLTAFEMFTDLALRYIHQAGHVKSPLEANAPYYLVVEIENSSAMSLDKAMQCFEFCMEQGWVVDGTLAQNSQQARDIWRLREDITEATSASEPYKNDVSVRVSKVPQFLQEMDAILKKDYAEFDVVWFGHIGDGNLHINILKPKDWTTEDFMKKCEEADRDLFAMIEKHGGSISAEHGVGLVKKAHLQHTRSEAEISIMKQIKKVFDPDGILNPGKIFD